MLCIFKPQASVRVMQTHQARYSPSTTKHPEKVILQQIDPSMLTNVDDPDNFVGRGSFGGVKVQLYRGVLIAVKQFLPRTVVQDVVDEA